MPPGSRRSRRRSRTTRRSRRVRHLSRRSSGSKRRRARSRLSRGAVSVSLQDLCDRFVGGGAVVSQNTQTQFSNWSQNFMGNKMDLVKRWCCWALGTQLKTEIKPHGMFWLGIPTYTHNILDRIEYPLLSDNPNTYEEVEKSNHIGSMRLSCVISETPLTMNDIVVTIKCSDVKHIAAVFGPDAEFERGEELREDFDVGQKVLTLDMFEDAVLQIAW